MTDKPHKFRYLLPPGNNFQFVRKFRAWLIFSTLTMIASIAALFVNNAVRGDYMNWTIDFKGGTEVHFIGFDKASGEAMPVDPAVVRQALEKVGEDVEVSEMDLEGRPAMVVRTTRFSAIPEQIREQARLQFIQKFGDAESQDPAGRKVTRASWAGDRFRVRSKVAITNAEAAEFFRTIDNAGKPMQVKAWGPEEERRSTTADATSGEFNQTFAIYGIDRQYEEILETARPDLNFEVANSSGIGAKAGAKLRDDATKALIYAICLIMLYLAFRFDIRYAPGAAFATIHDAVLVIGVFAITWTEVSLVSVAGLLTVVGFSVNDTVVVFDRIRENQAKLKDKSVERIVDISINEVLVRSILTSITVFATTLVMNIFGTGQVRNFAFAMNVGVIVGAYSSIFLAAPFFLYISKKWYSGPASARKRGEAAPSVPRPSASTDAEDSD